MAIVLFVCVLAIGVLGGIALVRSIREAADDRRQARARLAARAALVENRRAASAPESPMPVAPPPTVRAGELTSVLRKLEDSGVFAITLPAPAPPERLARGTATPPTHATTRPVSPGPLPAPRTVPRPADPVLARRRSGNMTIPPPVEKARPSMPPVENTVKVRPLPPPVENTVKVRPLPPSVEGTVKVRPLPPPAPRRTLPPPLPPGRRR